jgi:hypothetical protein
LLDALLQFHFISGVHSVDTRVFYLPNCASELMGQLAAELADLTLKLDQLNCAEINLPAD